MRWSGTDLVELSARLGSTAAIDHLTAGEDGAVVTSIDGLEVSGIKVLDDGRLAVRVVARHGASTDDVQAGVIGALGDLSALAVLVVDGVEIVAGGDVSEPDEPWGER